MYFSGIDFMPRKKNRFRAMPPRGGRRRRHAFSPRAIDLEHCENAELRATGAEKRTVTCKPEKRHTNGIRY